MNTTGYTEQLGIQKIPFVSFISIEITNSYLCSHDYTAYFICIYLLNLSCFLPTFHPVILKFSWFVAHFSMFCSINRTFVFLLYWIWPMTTQVACSLGTTASFNEHYWIRNVEHRIIISIGTKIHSFTCWIIAACNCAWSNAFINCMYKLIEGRVRLYVSKINLHEIKIYYNINAM